MQTLKLTKKYEVYPEYKDSGVEWLGVIPKNWNHKISKRMFREIIQKGQIDLPLASVTQDQGVVLRNESGLSVWNPGHDITSYKTVIEGDFVISLRSFEGGIEYSKITGLVSPAYVVLRKTAPIDSNYYKWLLKSVDYISMLNVNTRGIREGKNITYQDFATIPLPIPDVESQEKIAKYLDQKTNLIDEIISKKTKQIELLKEKRTSVINDKMNYINGEPTKIKHQVVFNPSKKYVSKTGVNDQVSFVPMESISETGQLKPKIKNYSEVKDGFTYFEDNDVVLAKITPCYENGKSGIIRGLINGFGFGTTEFIVMRGKQKILPEFLYFLVFSDKFRKLGEVEMRGTAGQKRVSLQFVREYEFNLPSIVSQKELQVELLSRLVLIDSALDKMSESIKNLLEFKSSLISNIVTGKVKV